MQPYIGSEESAVPAAEIAGDESEHADDRLVDLLNVLIICVVFVGVMLVLPVQHEYATLDDWIYARSVQNMLQTGRFVMPDMSQANLFGLTIWGVLWTGLLGFSFTTLTFSTLFMALVCLLAFYGIARAVNVPPWGALLGVGLLGFNTLFLHLSYTFMTDVPFLALMLLACYCYIRGVQGGSLLWLVFGGLFAGWSFLIRQFGALVPVVFFLYLVVDALVARRLRWREMLLVAAIPFAFLAAWYAWLPDPANTMTSHLAKIRQDSFLFKEPWPRVFALRSLAILPLTALFAWAAVTLPRSRWWLVPVIGATVIYWMYAANLPTEQWIKVDDPAPSLQLGPAALSLPQETFLFGADGNIVRTDGLDFFEYKQEPVWPVAVWWTIWLAGLALGILLLSKMGSSLWDWLRGFFRDKRLTPLAAVYAIGAVVFVASIALPGDLFDRYILAFIPFLILFVVRGSRDWGRHAWTYSIVALAILATFSLLAKADEISHDNARWQAAEWLASKVGAAHMSFDYDNWVGAESDAYQVADVPLPGFVPVRDFPYFSWLTFSERTVKTQELAGAPPVQP